MVTNKSALFKSLRMFLILFWCQTFALFTHIGPQYSDKSQSHTELKIDWSSSSNVQLTFSSLTVLFTALWRQKTESA